MSLIGCSTTVSWCEGVPVSLKLLFKLGVGAVRQSILARIILCCVYMRNACVCVSTRAMWRNPLLVMSYWHMPRTLQVNRSSRRMVQFIARELSTRDHAWFASKDEIKRIIESMDPPLRHSESDVSGLRELKGNAFGNLPRPPEPPLGQALWWSHDLSSPTTLVYIDDVITTTYDGLSIVDVTTLPNNHGRVHFGSEGGAPNGNMASCLGGGLKVLELQLHST